MQRAILFWGVCIPLRLYLASRGDVPALRVAAAVVAYRWAAGLETSRVGFFGGPAFWHDERPLHGILWLGYALSGDARWLYADTGFGALNWVKG